jgi:hypothetical protein
MNLEEKMEWVEENMPPYAHADTLARFVAKQFRHYYAEVFDSTGEFSHLELKGSKKIRFRLRRKRWSNKNGKWAPERNLKTFGPTYEINIDKDCRENSIEMLYEIVDAITDLQDTVVIEIEVMRTGENNPCDHLPIYTNMPHPTDVKSGDEITSSALERLNAKFTEEQHSLASANVELSIMGVQHFRSEVHRLQQKEEHLTQQVHQLEIENAMYRIRFELQDGEAEQKAKTERLRMLLEAIGPGMNEAISGLPENIRDIVVELAKAYGPAFNNSEDDDEDFFEGEDEQESNESKSEELEKVLTLYHEVFSNPENDSLIELFIKALENATSINPHWRNDIRRKKFMDILDG